MRRCSARYGFVAALFFASHAVADAPQKEAPAMWRIGDADSRIYLFGTFHVLPKGTEWTTPAYRVAMADAPTTVVEVDTKSAYARQTIGGLVFEHGLNASWETLRGVIGAERYAKVVALAKAYGLSTGRLQSYRPWLASLTLSAAAMRAAGFDSDAGVEEKVLADAKAEHDRVLHLEGAETQIKALIAIDQENMLENFDLMLRQLPETKEMSLAMLAAWKRGDLAALQKIAEVEDMRRQAPRAYQEIFTKRNANWVERIQEWLAGKGNYFVAAGAGHFAGPDSVVAMLQKKGIKVERVQ